MALPLAVSDIEVEWESDPSRISRRALSPLFGGGPGLRQKKATGFPGYCFVANRGSRSVTAVDLINFRVAKRHPLDAAPSAIVARPMRKSPKSTPSPRMREPFTKSDVASLAVSRRAWAGNQAVAMRLSPRNDALWVLYRDPASWSSCFQLLSAGPPHRVPRAAGEFRCQ